MDARDNKEREQRFWEQSQALLHSEPDIPALLALWEQDQDDKTDGQPVEYRDLAFASYWLKDDSGGVTGYLATWDEDQGKDIIERGAFASTVAEAKTFARDHGQKAIYPLLWNHDRTDPVGGILDASEDSHGLFIRANIDRSIEHGRQAYNALQGGYAGFSIGYKPVKYQWKGNIRHLQEIRLYEGSCTPFPMNKLALPTAS
jgi:HK97 family phage prohead protease